MTGEIVEHTLMASTQVSELVSTLQVRGVMANVFALRPEVHISEGRPIASGTSEATQVRARAKRAARERGR